MIPDFKTYIKESVWGDIYKRGAGEQIRTEDDINHLNRDEFYDYICSQYTTSDASIVKGSFDFTKFISIPVFIPENRHAGVVRIEADFGFGKKIERLVIVTDIKDCYEFKDELLKKFDTKDAGQNCFGLVPKYRALSKQSCVDLIDLIIKNVKKPEIQKREV